MSDKEGAPTTGDAFVKNMYPDVCLVDGKPTPFDICGHFDDHDMSTVSPDVRFTGDYVTHAESRIMCVEGNEEGTDGGINSGVNLGYCRPVQDLAPTVFVNGQCVQRRDTVCEMNCDGPEGPHNTTGKVVYPNGNGAEGSANADGEMKQPPFTDEELKAFESSCRAEMANNTWWSNYIWNNVQVGLGAAGAMVTCPAVFTGVGTIPGAIGCVASLDAVRTGMAGIGTNSMVPGAVETLATPAVGPEAAGVLQIGVDLVGPKGAAKQAKNLGALRRLWRIGKKGGPDLLQEGGEALTEPNGDVEVCVTAKVKEELANAEVKKSLANGESLGAETLGDILKEAGGKAKEIAEKALQPSFRQG